MDDAAGAESVYLPPKTVSYVVVVLMRAQISSATHLVTNIRI